MERSTKRDFIVGVFVLAGIVAVAWLSISVGGLRMHTRGGLKLSATFTETANLSVRAPVVIAGVRVGEISAISLDKDLRARVDMNLEPDLQLPKDSSAAIVTAGVLGDRYVELTPGSDQQTLASGDQVGRTESAVSLERVLSQFASGPAQAPNPPGRQRMKLSASFDETGSLSERAPVTIGGVRVGEVSNVSLDKDYRPRVDMELAPGLKLSKDTSAAIVSSGLIGGKYVELTPGGEDELLKSGDTITITQSAIVLEKVIGSLMYSLTKGGGTGPGGSHAPTTGPATSP